LPLLSNAGAVRSPSIARPVPWFVAAYHYQTDGVNDGGSIGSRGYINAWRVHEGFDSPPVKR
jgi:hypothetical protein